MRANANKTNYEEIVFLRVSSGGMCSLKGILITDRPNILHAFTNIWNKFIKVRLTLRLIRFN